jgi:hypothetical protein
MLESGSSGSVRGASRNGRPYREPRSEAERSFHTDNRKYRAPSTNGRSVYPLVRYSALQRRDRFAFIGRLSPPPARNAGLTEPLPSRRGSSFATHLRTSDRNLP